MITTDEGQTVGVASQPSIFRQRLLMSESTKPEGTIAKEWCQVSRNRRARRIESKEDFV